MALGLVAAIHVIEACITDAARSVTPGAGIVPTLCTRLNGRRPLHVVEFSVWARLACIAE